jgi:spore coat polysaccharide biosynthesis predicted glycosyltransferase SpsG
MRADASRSIGAGHVMRSSGIAEELIARGEDVVFVGQITDLNWVMDRIASLGFKCIYNESADFISNPTSDILILDSYDIPKNDSFITPKNWVNIIAIVDELTPDYQCSLRIHPGLDSNWIGTSKIPILSGPKYIPFRTSLSKELYLGNQNHDSLKIGVVAGGSDPHNLVLEIARILKTFTEDFEVYLFSNRKCSLTLDSRFKEIELGHDFDEQTKRMDLMLSTASTSSLEFLARGICVGIACAVDNQKQYFKFLGELGVAAQIGFRDLDNNWILDKEKIYSLITSRELRENLMRHAKGLIDFEGARRIVDAIKIL